MTNAPASRKTHIIRILGTNKAGDVLQDIWADVERMDEAKSAYQDEDGSWQGIVRRFRWLDDPDGDDFVEEGPPSRKVKIVKVCSPDETDINNPEQWIPIPVIVRMRSQASDQGKMVRLVNEELTDARIVENRRILHYDTNIDDEAQAAFNADPTRKVYVVRGDRYERIENTKDEEQYVEHQIIKYLKHRVNRETRTGSGSDQGKQTKLLNQYLIDESENATLEIQGDGSINPPYRLDPYQNIVNAKFKTNPRDLMLFGWGGGGFSHIRLGVRAGQATLIATSSYFGTAFQSGPFAGVGAVTPVNCPIAEVLEIDGTDLNGDGMAIIGSELFYTDVGVPAISDQISEDDSRAEEINVTGDKGINYFKTNEIDLRAKIYDFKASNGDYYQSTVISGLGVTTSYGLFDRKDNLKATVDVSDRFVQTVETFDLSPFGQSHFTGIIEDAGGKHFFVVTDYNAPYGVGSFVVADPSDPINPFRKRSLNFAPLHDTTVRVFDWEGTEVLTLAWGTSNMGSAVVIDIGAGLQDALETVATTEAYPTAILQLIPSKNDLKP